MTPSTGHVIGNINTLHDMATQNELGIGLG